jgi:hypothetical protein
MTLRFTAAFILLLCVGGLGLATAINQSAIVEAVNAKLPKDDQFNWLGWWLPKTLRLHRQYRRLYPDGGLVRREGILAAAMLFCIVLVATLIRFGVFGIVLLGGIGAWSLWLVYFRKSTPK